MSGTDQDMDASIRTPLINALDLVLDVICVVDAEGRFVAISAACEEVFGYTQQELLGKPFIDMVLPADRERTLEAASRVMAGVPLRNFENRYIRKDGEVIDIMWSARWSEADQLRLAVAHEITARKRAVNMQLALYGISEAAHSAADLPDMLGRIHQTIAEMLPTQNFCVALHDNATDELSFPYCVDEHHASPANCKLDPNTLTGEVIQTGTALLLTPESRDKRWSTIKHGAEREPVYWLGIPLIAEHRTIGALIVQSYDPGVQYKEQHKTLLQFVSTQIAANIERKRANARIQYMAQYDALTGLPNRTLFDDRLLVALSRAPRANERLALLYIDLDEFKPINDNFGHAAGDFLLQEIARRIKDCVRESDTVSRIGGDEFIVMLCAIQAQEYAVTVAENICAAINQPFELPRRSLQISASIGIATYPEHAGEQHQLIRNADNAMYEAKHGGGNRCLMFNE